MLCINLKNMKTSNWTCEKGKHSFWMFATREQTFCEFLLFFFVLAKHHCTTARKVLAKSIFECYYGEKFISKYMYLFSFSDTINLDSVQFSQSVGSDSAIPWTAACQVCLSITNSRGLFKFMSIETMMPSSHLILCCPLLLLPSIFPCIRVFSKESVLRLRWPKYWSFSLTISPFNEYSGLIPFRVDWFDLLSVQGTLKSFLQHHSSKASILWPSAFFMVQLSHPYMTTGKPYLWLDGPFSAK